MKIFSIFDSKAEAYLQPFFSPNSGTAIRSFSDAAKQEDSNFFKHSADFTLFVLGDFNEHTGVIVPLDAKQPLGSALEFLSMGERDV